MKIGNNIYKNRKKKNLSQKQLAEKIGVSEHMVADWESDIKVPDLENLKKLAILLEFSIDSILEIDEDKFSWLIIVGFIIGNALIIIFDNPTLGYVCGMIGLSVGYFLNIFYRNKTKK